MNTTLAPVNVSVLDEFAGSKSLEIKVAEYMFRGKTVLRNASRSSRTLTDPAKDINELSTISLTDSISLPRLPLIVWIDDNPTNITHLVSQARVLGITVLELPGTAEAKLWIDENLGTYAPPFRKLIK